MNKTWRQSYRIAVTLLVTWYKTPCFLSCYWNTNFQCAAGQWINPQHKEANRGIHNQARVKQNDHYLKRSNNPHSSATFCDNSVAKKKKSNCWNWHVLSLFLSLKIKAPVDEERSRAAVLEPGSPFAASTRLRRQVCLTRAGHPFTPQPPAAIPGWTLPSPQRQRRTLQKGSREHQSPVAAGTRANQNPLFSRPPAPRCERCRPPAPWQVSAGRGAVRGNRWLCVRPQNETQNRVQVSDCIKNVIREHEMLLRTNQLFTRVSESCDTQSARVSEPWPVWDRVLWQHNYKYLPE